MTYHQEEKQIVKLFRKTKGNAFGGEQNQRKKRREEK